jgi:hypothetical protein
MSRPTNPLDNASGERFMRTLKREEINANQYRDLDNLRAHIEVIRPVLQSTTAPIPRSGTAARGRDFCASRGSFGIG